MLSIAGSLRGLLDPEGEGTSGTVYSGKGRLIPEILNLKTGRDFVEVKFFIDNVTQILLEKFFFQPCARMFAVVSTRRDHNCHDTSINSAVVQFLHIPEPPKYCSHNHSHVSDGQASSHVDSFHAPCAPFCLKGSLLLN